MPTISQLPPVRILSSEDEVPISQRGSTCSVSIGDFLASTQPAIIVPSPSLLGRTSVGAGGPEGVEIGTGIDLVGGVIVANGADHATFPAAGGLLIGSDLVISDHGNQMLMPTATLRSLFSAGDNISIDTNGVISSSGTAGVSGGGVSLNSIASLQRAASLAAGDMVPVTQSGTAYAISYSNFLNGLTIDQAASSAAVADGDSIWVAQGSSAMTAQTFGAIWSWIAACLSRYRPPVLEIVANTTLSYSTHNGRTLVVTAPDVTITPNFALMGNGFECEIVTWSSAAVVWGAGIISTDGGPGLGSNSHARLFACSSSQGTLVMASVRGALAGSGNAVAAPGPISNLAVTDRTSSSLTLSWTAPTTGGTATSYAVQQRLSGTLPWASVPTSSTLSTVTIAGLSSGSSYDVQIAANNSSGTTSTYVQLLNVSTAMETLVAPGPPSGLETGTPTVSSVALTWTAPITGGSPTGYTVQYSANGGVTWSAVSFGNVTSATMAGLLAATTYVFRISAVNTAGSSIYVPTSAFPVTTTLPSAVTPGLPTNLSFSSTYSSSMTVQWTAPSGTVRGYNIQYRAANAPSWTVVSCTTTSITVTGLSSGTTYEFQVQSVNGAVTGAYTASSANTTTAATTGVYKLMPAPTRQSPTQGWVGTTLTRANGQPASGYNLTDSSAVGDGAYPVPASVGFAWSVSNTVVPVVTNAGSNGLTLDGHNLWYTWSVTYPSTAGNYYLWAIARDSAGNIGGTCVSSSPFNLL